MSNNNFEVNDDTVVIFYGQRYTIDSFANDYADGNKESAKSMIEKLLKKGQAKIQEIKTPVQKCFDNVAAEEVVTEAAQALGIQDELSKDAKAQKKREGRLVYPAIEIDFDKYLEALKFSQFCQNTLRLKDISINQTVVGTKVTVKDVTDNELNAINRYYTGLKVTTIMQDGMKKGAESATKAVDYAAQNVIAPAAQIGIKSLASLFKTAAKVTTRVSATAISSTIEGAKQTRDEIATDPDVIKAAANMITVKDAIKRKASGITPNSGIRIIQ